MKVIKMIKKYRKKPIIIEAVQYDGSNFEELRDFMGELYWNPLNECPLIKTLEGDMLVREGDYIIQGIEGEFSPCKPEIFEKNHEYPEKRKSIEIDINFSPEVKEVIERHDRKLKVVVEAHNKLKDYFEFTNKNKDILSEL